MANYQLLSDYGRYKAGSLLSDEAGDPIASIIANGAPLVPTVAALQTRAQQIKDTFGQPSKPEWQASAVFGCGTVVAEEGTVLNHRPVLNFIGAGVTAADDPTNNRINITISAEAITGWTDGGTLVYPTTATDDAVIGAQAMEGTERLRVVNSVPLVAAFESTDAGAVGCTISSHHHTASPVDNDVVFRWSFFGEADAGALTKTEFARLDVVATDVSDTTEDGQWRFYTTIDGTLDGTPSLLVSHYGVGISSRLSPTSGGEVSQTFDKGAAGANADVLGFYGFYGNDDGSNLVEWIYWTAAIDDAGAASKDASLALNLLVANVDKEIVRFDAVGAKLAKVATAAAAGSQAESRKLRLTGSMWDAAGAAEAVRDWDVYVAPSTLGDDETTARALLAFDFEGSRILSFAAGTADGATVNPIVRSNAADGATAGLEFRVAGNFGAANPAYVWSDTDGAGVLATMLGDGDLNLAGGVGMFGTAAPAAKHIHIADTAGDDAAVVNAILDVLEEFGMVATV